MSPVLVFRENPAAVRSRRSSWKVGAEDLIEKAPPSTPRTAAGLVMTAAAAHRTKPWTGDVSCCVSRDDAHSGSDQSDRDVPGPHASYIVADVGLTGTPLAVE